MMKLRRVLAEWLGNFSINTLQINGLVVAVLFAWPARSPDFNPLDFHLWGHLKSIVHATSIEHAEILRNRIEQGFRQIQTPEMMERVTRSQDACRLSSHFFASFVKVIKTENSLYLINEDRQNMYLYDFFSLSLGLQSAPEVGLTSYETPCIYMYMSPGWN